MIKSSWNFYCIITRTELPSCEAIDVRTVNIGSIVRPVTKLKAGKNLKGQTEFKAGTKFLAGTNFRDGLIFEADTNFKDSTNLKDGTNLICIPTSKQVPTSKLVQLLSLKLVIDGATMNILYQKKCDDKINMVPVPKFQHEYVPNDLQIWYQP